MFFFEEQEGYPVYYDQHLAEMHSFSSLQKSHPVNRSLIRYGFRTGAKAIQYSLNVAWVAQIEWNDLLHLFRAG